jgi:hypothetical protein
MEISEAARAAAIAGHLSVISDKKTAPGGAAFEN